jgi:polysaccharide pyruvyl transferase WcaK-like protein
VNKVLLAGYFGFNNYGDDLFVASFNKVLKQNFTNIYVVSACPSIQGVQSEWIVSNSYFSTNFSSLNIIGSLIRSLSIIFPSYRSDLIIHGGGSLFERHGLGVKRIIRASKRIRSSEVCLGISVSEKSLTNFQTLKFLKGMNLILVRDKYSEKILLEAGYPKNKLFYSGDVASHFIYNFPCNESRVRKNIGVSVCDCGGYSNQENSMIISSIVNFAKENKRTLEIFCLNPVDLQLSLDLVKAAQSIQVEATLIKLPSIQYIEKIQKCEVFVSMRMHGAITAYLKSTPFVLIEYEKKCSDFLNDIKYCKNGRVVDIQSLNKSLDFALNSYLEPLISPKSYASTVKNTLIKAIHEFLG